MFASPAVSVLIPSYNHGPFLAETISSALTQTVANIEVLILDDGSTDNSRQIIERLAQRDRRIRWWQQDNKGLIPTLNRMASEARAPFVAQIDSDDVWTPERLAWGLQDMAQNPGLSVSFTSYLRIDGQGRPVPRADQLSLGALNHEALLARMTVKNSACACTAFMRHEALKKIGDFARPFTLSHDWDRWLRLSLVGALKMRGSLGAFYRHHDGNQSLDVGSTRRQELDIHDALAETLISHHGLDAAQQLAIYGRAAALAFDTEQPDKMVHWLAKKSRLYPLFEHEQVWLLHTVLQQRLALPHSLTPEATMALRQMMTGDNGPRLDKILAYAP